MKINALELLGKHKNCILAHLILEAGSISEYKKQFEEVTKTIHESKDKLLDIKIVYNGIEFDGQILENLIQEQWNHVVKKLENKYSNLDELAEQKANVLFNQRINDLKQPTIEKLYKIQSMVDKIYTELDVL